MAKYIDADKAIEALDNLCDAGCQYSKIQRSVMCGACPLGGAFDAIDDIPAADVAEVVRCKDCKHKYGYKCDYDDRPVGMGDYCSRGERMDGDTE